MPECINAERIDTHLKKMHSHSSVCMGLMKTQMTKELWSMRKAVELTQKKVKIEDLFDGEEGHHKNARS